MCEDIILLYDNDNSQKAALIELLYDTLQLSDYKGNKRFEEFKKRIDKNLLQALRDYERYHDVRLWSAIERYTAEKRNL